MRRRLIKLLLILLVFIGVAILAAGWLLKTESGAQWILSRAASSLEDQLSFSSVRGTLGDGLIIEGFRYKNESLEIGVSQLEAAASVSWGPWRLSVNPLTAQGVSIKLLQGHLPEGVSGQRNVTTHETIQAALADLQLPMALSLENVTITDIDVFDTHGQKLLYLNKISLAAHWKQSLLLNTLLVEAPGLTANLHGQLDLFPPFESQWTAAAKVSVPGLRGDGPAAVDLTLDIEGLADIYSVNAVALIKETGLPEIRLQLSAQGDFESLSIDKLDAGSDFAKARFTGAAQWVDREMLELNIDITFLDPAILLEKWPAEQFIHGGVSVRYENGLIQVNAFNINIAGTKTSLEGSGVFDPFEGVLEAKIIWQQLGWPVAEESFDYLSDRGEIMVSGAPSDWRFEAEMEFETQAYPGGLFVFDGFGDKDSAQITIAKGEALGGNVAGTAGLDWSGAFRWNADLAVEQVDLEALLSDWPARLDASLSLEHDTGRDYFSLQIDSLHGDIQNQRVDGSGGLIFDASNISFQNIQLSSGESAISLDGALDGAAGVSFSFDVRRPGWMADLLGGEIKGSGRIAPRAPQPLLDLELEAHQLAWGDTRIEKILINLLPGTGGDSVKLTLQAENIELAGFELRSANAVINSEGLTQTMELSLSAYEYQLQARVSGKLSDWSSLAESHWSGNLLKLSLERDQLALLSLQETTALTISANQFSIGQLSFGQGCFDLHDSGVLCLQSSWQAGQQSSVEARLLDVPLSISKLFFDHQVEFTQRLNGEIKWFHRSGKLPSGHATITVSAGKFGAELEKSERVSTAEGFVGFELHDGNLTAGQFDIPFPGVGEIDLDFAVTGLALDGGGIINGRIRVDLDDVGVMEDLFPALENIGGQLNTDLKLSGVTIDPELDGTVSYTNGHADIPLIGTQLRNINLLGNVQNNNKATITGGFDAGVGHGEIDLTAEFSDWLNPALDLAFSGSSLRLLNLPDLRMDADADIRFGWRQGEWSIDGRVIVQQARLAPITSIVNKVTESEDTQIVAGELPYQTHAEPGDPLRLTGNLEIKLGDDVLIETDAAKLKLSGAVMLQWSGDTIPIADGSIHGDGEITIFGPKLHINDGQLRFPEIPVNNPLLDIRAERDIFGNTQIRAAGVSITGSVKRPVIEAYTNPHTTKDRAWALLITGSDVDLGQGIGAVEVGTYIAPKLYLSYGISLFDNENIISARYDLKKGFGIKVSSSERESGVDMSYTIDR